jgi:hypothetical protein
MALAEPLCLLLSGVGTLGIAKQFLESGADVNTKDRHGWTPLRESEVLDRRASSY